MEKEERRAVSFRFSKEDRLHHRSLVEGLFRFGKSFYEFPFRVTWRKLTEEELRDNFRNIVPEKIGQLQMMVTVPKKKRRHAVDRVLLRRRIREAYRLNRHPLYNQIGENEGIRTLSVALVYVHDQNLPYMTIEEKMKVIIDKLQRKITPEQP